MSLYMGTMQAQTILSFETGGTALYEITDEVAHWVRQADVPTGLLTLFCQHTSASLLITENASAAVHRDMLRWLARLAPESGDYDHAAEGPDDMPAHLKAALTGNSLTIPVADGRMLLGTWQGIYLAEHRRAPHRRQVVAHLAGD
jgi:secondary thiamine-phosphate synthase enzyme